jgi:lipopolysaccharide export system protein LptA
MHIPVCKKAIIPILSSQGIQFSLLLLLLPMLSNGQVKSTPLKADTTAPQFIIIDHVGNMIENTEGIEPVKWLSKGLQLRKDSTYIYADSAVIFGEDRVYAFKDVVIQQGDSLNVFTDTLYYFRQTDVADLIGEVALQQGTKQLWTTDLTYHLGEQYGIYSKGGILIDKDLQVSSKQGVYYADREEAVFKDSVVVLHPDFNLAADSMKYLARESRVIFTGPTNIYTPEAKIYCESGYYDLKNETAEFNQHAQYAGDRKKATADTIRYASGTGEIQMSGNVIVEEDGKRIQGNYLQYLETTGETVIKGDPAIYNDSTRIIRSPEIFYNEKTNQVTTKGSGEIHDGDLVMKAEQFDFDEASGIGRAVGKVMWSDTVKHLGIMADTVFYAKESDYILAYGHNRSMFYTVIEKDTLFIAADTLNMITQVDTSGARDSIRLIKAYHDVRLLKSDMQGRADSLVFNDRDSLFMFFGDPVLWSDTTQFSADSIEMNIRNNQIDDVTLHQKAIIVTELYGTYYDQIKGKSIVAHFDSSAIQEMWVTGNAESIYYTRDEQSAFIGVNKTICSKMYFTFIDNNIHLLKYYGENSSQMMPMGEADHGTMRLEGFRWRSEERPRHIKDLLK